MVSILNKILILIAALLIIFIAGILLLRKLSTARAKICYSIIGCLVLALVAAGLFIDLQREKKPAAEPSSQNIQDRREKERNMDMIMWYDIDYTKNGWDDLYRDIPEPLQQTADTVPLRRCWACMTSASRKRPGSIFIGWKRSAVML